MRTRAALAGFVSLVVLLGAMQAPAAAEPVAAVRPGNVLALFDTTSPGEVTTLTITGLAANETVRGIDARPSTGEVFIQAVTTGSATNSVVRTYTLNTDTGVATFVGQTAAALDGAGDVPTGWDFNPLVDRVRYVNVNDENARINPATGALAGEDIVVTPSATTSLIAVGYDRNRPEQGQTTVYCVDRNDSQLCTLGGVNSIPSPNTGQVDELAPLGFNLNQARDGGLDVSHNGTAYAALTDAADNLTRLYRITLVTGGSTSPAATLLGLIGNGQSEVHTMTLLDVDPDLDGLGSGTDNCAFAANADQANLDGDAQGDVCDEDDDNDGIPDVVEPVLGTNPRSADSDGDGRPDGSDRCPTLRANTANGCPDGGPAVRFTIAGFRNRITLAGLRRNGLAFSVTPNRAAAFVVQLLGRVRGGRLARVGDVVLAERRLRRAAGRRRVRLRVPRSQRRRLRRRTRLQVQVTARDARGTTSTRTRRLRVN